MKNDAARQFFPFNQCQWRCTKCWKRLFSFFHLSSKEKYVQCIQWESVEYNWRKWCRFCKWWLRKHKWLALRTRIFSAQSVREQKDDMISINFYICTFVHLPAAEFTIHLAHVELCAFDECTDVLSPSPILMLYNIIFFFFFFSIFFSALSEVKGNKNSCSTQDSIRIISIAIQSI